MGSRLGPEGEPTEGEISGGEADQETIRELEELLLHDIGIISEEEREQLRHQIEEKPESIGLDERALTLSLPENLVEEFKEDRQKVIEAMIARTREHAEQWFEENLPGVENKEKAVEYLTQIETQVIQDNSREFVEGRSDDIDLSHITILVKVAEYENADGQEVQTVVGFGLTTGEIRPQEITNREQKEEITEAKEEGEYREETK